MLGLFKQQIPAQRLKKRLEKRLDQILYKLPGTNTPITWADAVEGTLVLGATGSGKSSGPGQFIAHAMLRAGFGFCVLCVKPDEKDRWVNYARQTGRTKDVVIFNKESGLQFNFLQYELKRKGQGAGDVFNVNNALMNLNEQARQFLSGGSGNNDERFWDNALRRLISSSIIMLNMADENVSVTNMRRLVSASFTGDEVELYNQLTHLAFSLENIDHHQRQKAKDDLEDWSKENYFLHVLLSLQADCHDHKHDDIEMLYEYWLKEFARLSDRSRSIVVESFMGIVEPFKNKGILKDQFTEGLSPELLPENIIENKKIVIVDYPIKEFGISGLFASILYKSIFQSAMERRNILHEKNPKPVGFFMDEYQAICNPLTDSQFQATARSSWVATVIMTQNIQNLYHVMGHQQPQARAKSLLGNLNLKFFANNADMESNKWASDMIGQHLTTLDNISMTRKMELSKTKQQRLMQIIHPNNFTTLKTGRKENRYRVEAVVFKPGKLWGRYKHNYAVIEFKQRN